MTKFRNIFGMLAVMALFALATAPPTFAIGGGTTDIIIYLENSTDNTSLNTGAGPYDGDILAQVTSAIGMKTDFAANDVKESEFITLTANMATEGGGFFGTGGKVGDLKI